VRLAMEENKEKIKNFLSRFLRNYDLQPDDDIFALGFVNSLFAMQLVMFVEKELGVQIEDEDLDLQNFNTINAIADFVQRKLWAAAATA
jgi:acyl carrier protein